MNVPSVNLAIRSGVHHLGGRTRGLPSLTLKGVAAGGAVMSNVASVITTTINTIVASVNAAVSFGRWSNRNHRSLPFSVDLTVEECVPQYLAKAAIAQAFDHFHVMVDGIFGKA